MKSTTFNEYQAAKSEIISGQEGVIEHSSMDEYGVIHKSWSSPKGGTFYEVFNTKTGWIEYWSTKHGLSRYYREERG